MTTEEIKKQTEAANTAASPSRSDQIAQMYEAQKEANRQQLEAAYRQNLSNAEAARDKIAPQYQQSANDLTTQYERERRNFNQQALASGLNTGTASQAQLSRTNEYLRDFGKLRSSETEAMAEADRGITDLKTQYQNAIAAAAADSDYRKAAALLDEYNNQYSRDLAQAQQLAQFGDFSMFATLYGQDAADNMLAVWKAQNPDLAYNTGKITAEEYKAMTGKYPVGYRAPSSGGGGGYYYGGSSGKTGDTDGDNNTGGKNLGVPAMSHYDVYKEAQKVASEKGTTAAAYYLNARVNAGQVGEAVAKNIASYLK